MPYSSSRARPARLVAALVVAFALLAGCGGDDDDTTTTNTSAGGGGPPTATAGVFVGEVEGTDDSIALVTDGNRLSGAALCIPKEVVSWIQPAPLTDGKAPLVARRGETLGEATFAGDRASGNVNVGGSRSFSAKLATGYAGLYRTTSGPANKPGFSETGWIVLPNGNICGSTNSITASGGFKSEPAPSKPEGQGRITDFADPFPF